MEEKSFKFSKDEDKVYGIEYYFEEVLKSEHRIKGLGIITSDDYSFYMFDGSVDHINYTNKYSDDSHEDKVMFSCDNETGKLTLIFNCRKLSEIPDSFVGKTMIKVLEEYKNFLKKHHDELKHKQVKMELSNNFYKENTVVPYKNKNLDDIEQLIGTINISITSLYEEVYNAEEEKRELEAEKRKEKNPMYKILKKYLKNNYE